MNFIEITDMVPQIQRFKLIMCYKILNNLVCIDADLLFKRSVVCNTRGNSMKLNKCHINSNRDGHFFSNRVINAWNSLSD